MKYLLIAIGTRGDIEPFLAIGEYLKAAGHAVFGAFPEQFGPLALESGIEFRALDKAFLEMIEGDVGKMALGGTSNLFQRIKAYYQLYKKSKAINDNIFQEQFNYLEEIEPDRVIHSIKATVPTQWGFITQKPVFCLSPIPCVTHAIEGKSSMALRGKNFGKTINKWTYLFTRYATIKNLRSFLKKLDKEDPGQKQLVEAMLEEPAIYTVSPDFFNLSDQPSHVHFLGYQERNKTQHWQPKEELKTFIAKHEKLLFVTFGSMSNPEPEKKTQMIIKALVNQDIPAVINTAGGGLMKPDDFDEEQFYFLDDIPYDYILPKVYACIHHGGGGTTHLSIKYGCATTIIPHIVDQYFWNNVLSDLGVGPKGKAISKLNEKYIENIIQQLWHNLSFKKEAESLAKKMEGEDYQAEITRILTS